MAKNQIEIPIKLGGIAGIKAELKSLKDQLADATDPEQIAALADRAGALQQKLAGVNNQIAEFKSGSNFDQVRGAFDGLTESVSELNFSRAAKESANLNQAIKAIQPADLTKQFKGFTSTIQNLGKTFVSVGLKLLTNPIFLLAAVITAIVAAVVIFLKKIGVLDKIFKVIQAALQPLIDGFKQLTEWLGLSTAASDDAAEKIKANNEKIVESSKKRTEAQIKGIDQEIKLSQSLGKDTEQLEIKKTRVTEKEAKKRIKITEKGLKELKDKTGKLAEEETARLKKQLEDDNDLVKQAQVDRQAILNKIATEKKQKQKEQEKKEKDEANAKAKEAYQNYKSNADAIQKEIDAANKLVLDSTKTQQQREIDDVKAKYDALIKEAKKYKKDITGLEAAKNLEIEKINKEAADKEIEYQKGLSKELSDFKQSELDREEEIAELIYQAGLSAKDKELEEKKYYYDNLIAEAQRYGQDAKVFEDLQRTEIAAINKKYDEEAATAAKEKAQKAIDDEKAIRDAKIEIAASLSNSLNSLGETFIKDQKKLEKFNKAQALIQIGIDTAKAISALVAQSQANPLNAVTAGAAGFAQYAAGIVQIVTNIAKAKALLTNPSATSNVSAGGGGGSSESSSSSSLSSFVPGNLFGQGNNLNTVGQPKSVEANQSITVKAVVSETEMTGVQTKVNKILKNAVL